MTLPNSLKWIIGVLFAPVVLAALLITIFGWNWLRGPIERMTTERTGRVLAINGDLTLKLGWPLPHIRATSVTFANPAWAREKQMLTADAVDVTIHLPQLLARNIVLPEVRLERPVVFLEQAGDGRRNWLLDLEQQDEGARIRIDRLSLDQGRLGYDDVAQKTGIRAELSTSGAEPNAAEVSFSAQGQFKGMPLKASGKGGPVLGLRDEATPYPLQTELALNGVITLDGRGDAIQAHVRLKARKIQLSKVFPTSELGKTSIGQVNGNFDPCRNRQARNLECLP